MADPRRRTPSKLAAGTALACACVFAALLGGCGNTLQDKPVANIELEQMLQVQRYPIYWLGSSFDGLDLTSATADPGGAYALQYGNCFVGGQEACLTPLEVISSPEASFLPGAGAQHTKPTSIRGTKGMVAQNGEVLDVATGPVVVEIRSRKRMLAFAAAKQMVPINELGEPGATLPAAKPDRESEEKPLATQQPHPLKLLPPIPAKTR